MRVSSFLRAMDNTEIEARFSNDSAIRYEEIFDASVSYEDIKPFLCRLPPREVDLIELYYCERKNQKDIAKIFGVTQGAVSSRLARAKKRLQFLRDLPKISESEIDKDLGGYFDHIELAIIKYMMLTTCQSKTAEIINTKFNLLDEKDRMTQVKVRHRFERCRMFLDSNKSKKPELGRYSNLMEFIKKNLYKLHEVKLPHFDRGSRVIMSLLV
jgi:hypothetical protein